MCILTVLMQIIQFNGEKPYMGLDFVKLLYRLQAV